MGDQSKIEWTDATWNFVIGCTQVSAGCDHCYAMTMHNKRHKAWEGGTFPGAPKQYHKPFSEVQIIPERLEMPLRWQKPRKIFVNSLADLFHKDVPTDVIDQAFGVMAASPKHTFQILTKRPQRMLRYLSDPETKKRIWHAGRPLVERIRRKDMYDIVPVAKPGQGPDWCYPAQWPLPNVWVGTSVENQEAAYRIDYLIQTPAAVRFLSCEPLIGPLDLEKWLWLRGDFETDTWVDAVGRARGEGGTSSPIESYEMAGDIHWVIVGGESGYGHRPIDPEWVRALRDDCNDADVAFLFKQWGGHTSKAGGRDLDGRTWDEFPE